MNGDTKVLAISKRTADLCASQALLHTAGFGMVTATSLSAARAVIGALRIKAVIICRHSWTDAERAGFVRELAAMRPKLKVTMQCPGCTGFDDHHAGTLTDTGPLKNLITQLNPAANS